MTSDEEGATGAEGSQGEEAAAPPEAMDVDAAGEQELQQEEQQEQQEQQQEQQQGAAQAAAAEGSGDIKSPADEVVAPVAVPAFLMAAAAAEAEEEDYDA